MRSLRLSCLAPGVGTFVDCIEHSLVGDHPAVQLKQQMLAGDTLRISLTSINERMGELLAVDLNPFGQLIRFASSDLTIANAWDAYNKNGNVVSAVGFDELNAPIALKFQASKSEVRSILSTHEKIRFSYQGVLMNLIRKNQDKVFRARKIEDVRVSAVCRIYGVNQLVLELSEFFEEYPKAKVSDVCQRLSIHPRFLERQMHDFGISAMKIKRACMLSLATHEILWSNRNFNEIAISSGYTHGAHLSRVVFVATGGLTPSVLRTLARG
jgi:AraC-like DNA-binding protein